MKRVKLEKWQWGFVGFLAMVIIASVAVQLFGHHEESEENHFWSNIPLFWVFFGIIGGWILIFFAKIIVGTIVLKKEDYYHE